MAAIIDRLPDEILSRIFTVSTEVPLDFYSKIDRLKYDPDMYKMIPHKRRMKPMTRMITSVCQHWNAMVHSPGNSNLWIAAASLVCGGYPYPLKDPIHQLIQFRDILTSSRQCDLDIVFLFNWDDDSWGIDDHILATRMFIHALAWLDDYTRQLRSFRVASYNNESESCVLAFMHNMGHAPGLDWFALVGPPGS